MIKADIEQIEALTDIVTACAYDSEEMLDRMNRILHEMMDDLELNEYPQSAVAIEAAGLAADSIELANDTLLSLRGAVLPAADMYRENEMKSISALSRMTVMLDNAATGYNAALTADGVSSVEHSDQTVSHDKVMRLVAESTAGMQLTNIAAVTKAAREEYAVSELSNLSYKGQRR